MRRLILFRHAEAEKKAPDGGDFQRALTAKGRADARATAERLAAAGFAPDRALVSAAVRTAQTWEIASALFPAAQAELKRDLFGARMMDLLAIARRLEDETTMIVGHNPAMQELAAALARTAGSPEASNLATSLPTATAVVFDLSDPAKPALAGVFLGGEAA